MAWNDPPSFNYQQLSDSGKKLFKHRYVSDTKLGQSTAQFHQQAQVPQPNSMMHLDHSQSQQAYPVHQQPHLPPQQPQQNQQLAYQQQQHHHQQQHQPLNTQQPFQNYQMQQPPDFQIQHPPQQQQYPIQHQ